MKCGFAALVWMALALPAAADSFLTVQPVISGSATVSPAFLLNQEQYADAIFNQIGLSIRFLPSIPAPGAPTSYDSSNSNEASLFFGDASFTSPPVLTVWFVNTITYKGISDRGLSQQNGVDFGSWIASSAVNDTLAHEIANDLSDLQETGGTTGLSGSPTYLLEVGTDRNIPSTLSQIFAGSNYDQITVSQAHFMLGNSQFVQTVPEPPSSVLALLGALALVAAGSCSRWRCFRT